MINTGGASPVFFLPSSVTFFSFAPSEPPPPPGVRFMSSQNFILRKKASVWLRSWAPTSPLSFLYCLAIIVSPRGDSTKKFEIIVVFAMIRCLGRVVKISFSVLAGGMQALFPKKNVSTNRDGWRDWAVGWIEPFQVHSPHLSNQTESDMVFQPMPTDLSAQNNDLVKNSLKMDKKGVPKRCAETLLWSFYQFCKTHLILYCILNSH